MMVKVGSCGALEVKTPPFRHHHIVSHPGRAEAVGDRIRALVPMRVVPTRE